MSLLKKIQEECEAHELEFYYDNGQGLDYMLSNADYSQNKCVVYAFLLSTTSFKDGKESANIGLFFSKLTEFDAVAIENEEIIESCIEIAYKFIRRIERGNKLTIGDVSLTRFYDQFSVNVTGVGITTEFAETTGYNECLDDYQKHYDKFCTR